MRSEGEVRKSPPRGRTWGEFLAILLADLEAVRSDLVSATDYPSDEERHLYPYSAVYTVLSHVHSAIECLHTALGGLPEEELPKKDSIMDYIRDAGRDQAARVGRELERVMDHVEKLRGIRKAFERCREGLRLIGEGGG